MSQHSSDVHIELNFPMYIYVTAVGSFTVRLWGFPIIPVGPEFRVSAQGPQDPN